MIKLVLFLCFILLACANNENVDIHSKKDIECMKYFEPRVNNYVYKNLQLAASPKDGIKAVLSTFILEFHPSSVEPYVGTFQFEFFIDSFGKLQKVFILNKTQNQLTESEKEAIKIMSSIIEWNPAMCNKIAVNSRVIIPIKI